MSLGLLADITNKKFGYIEINEDILQKIIKPNDET